MNKKIRRITQTALMLALLVSLQVLTKPAGQLVTGSCVNLILAVTTLFGGLYSGLTVALFSPVLAFLLGIAPQILTVPAIMAGNCVLALALHFIGGNSLWRQVLACVAGAALKFGVLYGAVAGLICGVFADSLLQSGMLKAPMLQALPVSFGITQLITALIGSAVALPVSAALRKALKR